MHNCIQWKIIFVCRYHYLICTKNNRHLRISPLHLCTSITVGRVNCTLLPPQYIIFIEKKTKPTLKKINTRRQGVNNNKWNSPGDTWYQLPVSAPMNLMLKNTNTCENTKYTSNVMLIKIYNVGGPLWDDTKRQFPIGDSCTNVMHLYALWGTLPTRRHRGNSPRSNVEDP